MAQIYHFNSSELKSKDFVVDFADFLIQNKFNYWGLNIEDQKRFIEERINSVSITDKYITINFDCAILLRESIDCVNLLVQFLNRDKKTISMKSIKIHYQ